MFSFYSSGGGKGSPQRDSSSRRTNGSNSGRSSEERDRDKKKKKKKRTDQRTGREQEYEDPPFQGVVTAEPEDGHLQEAEVSLVMDGGGDQNMHSDLPGPSSPHRPEPISSIESAVIDSAEQAAHGGGEGAETIVQSNSGEREVKFKKAKKLTKKASKHYLKHIKKDTRGGRFRAWRREELIEVIVTIKNFELRNERDWLTEGLRELCDSLFKGEPTPEKPHLPQFDEIIYRIVAARRIQNAWIIYQAMKRDYQEEQAAEEFNNRLDDFDESNIQELGRAELLMMTSVHEETVGDRVITEDVETGKVDDQGNAVVRPVEHRKKRNILDLPWTPPDYKKAIAYANYVQPRKGGKGGQKYDFFTATTGRHCCLTGWGEQFDLWDEGQISEFSPYGPGITNYFKFLKWAFWVFVLLTIAALPILVLNMVGSNNKSSGLSTIAKTTIGNLATNAGGYLDVTTNGTEQIYYYNTTVNIHNSVSVHLPGCADYGFGNIDCYLNGNTLAVFYSIIDIIIASLILIAYIWLSFFEKVEEKELNQNTVLASHYTVQVSNFPPDTTEQQLREHFSKVVGKKGDSAVADISFAYDNSYEILLCKARGDIIRRKVRLVHEHRFKCTKVRARTDWAEQKKEAWVQKEREKLKAQMNSYNEDLKRKDKSLEQLASSSPTPIAAFVTFNYVTDQKLALEKYNHNSFLTIICGHPLLNLKGRRLRVRQAPEPSVIVWENMEFGSTNRFFRNVATFILSLLLVAISLVMIFSSKYLQQTALNNGYSSNSLCPVNFYDFTNIEQIAITTQYPNLLYCYCNNISLTTSSSVCGAYYKSSIKAQILTYFASFIVIIVNNLIERMVRYSAQFEKHHSSDGMSMSIFIRLFTLKFINTAAVFLINNNNIILQKIFGLQSSSSSVEYSASWYFSAGVQIVLVQLGDAFNAQSRSLMQYFQLHRQKQASKEHTVKALTQEEMNKLQVGPEFEFAFNYAQLMSTFFVCLTFSTGIPILYPIAAFNFLFFYFMEKYMFIHMYKIPPHFTTLVGRRATTLIPLAILVHLAMSVWMLSNNELFVSQSQTNSNPTLVSSFQFGRVVRDKITGRATFPLFMTFCAIVVLHLLYYGYKYFKQTLSRAYDFLFGFVTVRKKEAKIKKSQKENWKAKVPFTRAVMRNLIKGLSSYNILRNPEYKEAFGITWKFAVENKDVRAVRQMKAKAQASVEDEDAQKADELQRQVLVSSANGQGNGQQRRLTRSESSRNRSFYTAVASTNDLNRAPPSARPAPGPSARPVSATVELATIYPPNAGGGQNIPLPPGLTPQQQQYYLQQQQQAYYAAQQQAMQQQQQQAYYAQQQAMQQQQQYHGGYHAVPSNQQHYL